jgi:prepilin peptidase CpaA
MLFHKQLGELSIMLQTLSVSILPTLFIIAAMTDVSNYKIPNWLTGLTAVLFFPMALWAGMPLVDFGWHLVAGIALFAAGFALFSVGFFGGGDAKLMAAAGLWFGTSNSLDFLMMTVLAGGVLALAVCGWTVVTMYWEFQGSHTAIEISRKLKTMNPKLPYGFALCVGAILAFPNTWWMTVS